MARENLTFLRGVVVKKPFIVKNGDEYIYALANINVGRSERKVGDKTENYMKCDNPPIMTRDEECIKEMAKWEPNDVVGVKGVISSKHIKKGSICPHCGKKNSFTGAFVFVNPIFVEKICSCKSEKDALNYLVEHREVSNQVFIFGTLCRDPKKIIPKKDLIVTQYQIAMNRKYRIKSDAPEVKTDYPWVKSYGDNAIEDHNRLFVGSEVFIDGCLQARSINRKAICGQLIGKDGKGVFDSDGNPVLELDENDSPIGCGGKYDWKDRAMEIVPFETEYISGYRTDEEIEAREEERVRQRMRDLGLRDDVSTSEMAFSNEDGGYETITEDDIDAGIDTMGLNSESEDNKDE